MKTDSSKKPTILAVESSCDETAVALLRGHSELLSSVVRSQIALHAPHGGVVPEIASRNHLLILPGLVREALRQSGLQIGTLMRLLRRSVLVLPRRSLWGLRTQRRLLSQQESLFCQSIILRPICSPRFLETNRFRSMSGLWFPGATRCLFMHKGLESITSWVERAMTR